MASTRQDAFALYLSGSSLRSVASRLGVGRATIERWSVRYAWVSARREAWLRAAEAAADAQAERFRRDRELAADQIYSTFLDAIAQHRAYVGGSLPRRALRYGARDLARLAEAVVLAGNAESQSLARWQAQ